MDETHHDSLSVSSAPPLWVMATSFSSFSGDRVHSCGRSSQRTTRWTGSRGAIYSSDSPYASRSKNRAGMPASHEKPHHSSLHLPIRRAERAEVRFATCQEPLKPAGGRVPAWALFSRSSRLSNIFIPGTYPQFADFPRSEPVGTPSRSRRDSWKCEYRQKR